MTRFGRLVLIGVLAGTLGLIGCSSDGGGGAAGSGGSGGGAAGSGGTAGGGGTDPGTGGGGGAGGGGEPGVCGAGEEIDDSYETDTGGASCNGLDVITVPIEVVLAAKADLPLADGENDVDVRVSLNLSEDTVGDLGILVQEALIGEASADVDEVGGDAPTTVAGTTPCTIDFTDDPDDNGTPGPIELVTPATVAAWTAVDGSIVLEVVDITFAITQPVPLTLSTGGSEPACTWNEMPRVVLGGAM